MKRTILSALTVLALGTAPIVAQTVKQPIVKTRLEAFSGTDFVLVINYIPYEVTAITCDSWTMLGIKSWHDQNNFTIPAATPLPSGGVMPSVAVMNAHKFNGYCAKEGSIIAHTDEGDYTSNELDRGAGMWEVSTKLTLKGK
jgi:hypothetical protein